MNLFNHIVDIKGPLKLFGVITRLNFRISKNDQSLRSSLSTPITFDNTVLKTNLEQNRNFTIFSPMDKTKWLVEQFSQHITDNKKVLFADLIENRTRHVTVVLENLFQPHNASAVMRSCDCFGIQDAHIIENYNKYEVNREIDMGSSKWLNTYKYKNAEHNTLEAINHLKAKGYKIVATTPHTDDCLIDELPIDQPIALMFGTELGGLTDVALENADAYVKLPMYGFTESYNISVCVALALFSVTERMRKDNTIDWQLTEQEKNEILLAWTKNVVKHPGKVEAIYNERFEEE